MPRFLFTPPGALALSVLFLALWQGLVRGLPALEIHSYVATLDLAGWVGLFIIGLGWTIFFLQRLDQRYERKRVAEELALGGDRVDDVLVSVGGEVCKPHRRIWNPFDLGAWYYGRSGQRLKQSMLSLFAYAFAFVAVYLTINSSATAGVDPFDLPSGGGQEMAPAPKVQIKKVIRKKYILNPLSNLKFAPKIEQIDVALQDEARNEYKVGQGAEGGAIGRGDGKGAGYGSGTGRGKARFIRLVHSDRAWDKNFGISGDRNMLLQYGALTDQKIADATEAITFDQLRAFPHKQSPALVYVGGAQRFQVTSSEQKILREYLLDRHGMILGDNLGGQGFHQQFIATMNAITGTTPVPIARDDRIHQAPFQLPSLPFVVAHGGTVALGWKVDGRWVAYYHPGALSDAWRDDHAGIRREIYEMCFRLGVNILEYAHREKDKWLESQR